MKKRITALLLTLAMLVTFMPAMTFSAFAATTTYYKLVDSISGGDVVILVGANSAGSNKKAMTYSRSNFSSVNVTVSKQGETCYIATEQAPYEFTIERSSSKNYLKTGSNYFNYYNGGLQITDSRIDNVTENAPIKIHHDSEYGSSHDKDYYLYNNNNSWTAVDSSSSANVYMYKKITTPVASYNVTLNTNGGSIATGENLSSYVSGIGAAVTLPTPTKNNNVFMGWYENSDFSGEAVTEIAADATGDKTFYAKWIDLANVYKITLKKQSNSGAQDTKIEYIPKGTGTAEYTVPDCQWQQSSKNWFKYWTDGSHNYGPNKKINITDNTTLYGAWDTTSRYAQYGAQFWDDKTIISQLTISNKVINAYITIPECPISAPAGMVFDCWKDQNQHSYQPNDTYALSGNATFTIQWKEHEHGDWNVTASGNVLTSECGVDNCFADKKAITLKLVANDTNTYTGGYINASFESDTAWKARYNETPEIVYYKLEPGKAPQRVRAAVDPGNYMAAITVDGATATKTFAVVKRTQTITAADVTCAYLDTDVAVEVTNTPEGTLSYAVTAGDAVTIDASTGDLTIVKPGSATVTVTAAETDYDYVATQDVTVTVNKAAASKATLTITNPEVTFDGNTHEATVTGPAGFGTISNVQYALATEPEGDKTAAAPSAKGTYNVYVDAAEGDYYLAGTELFAGTFTIKEQSTPPGPTPGPVVEEATVTFNVQGHGTAPAAVKVEIGSMLTNLPVPTADGYAFGGWFKDSKCTQAWDRDKDTVAGDMTLYAKWTEAEPIEGKKVEVGHAVLKGDEVVAPTIRVDGEKLSSDDVVVTYEPKIDGFGEYTATITFKGGYYGTIVKKIQVAPQKGILTSAKAGKKKVTVKWKKVAGISGYQIAYKAKGAKKYTYRAVKSSKAVSKTIKKLKKGKKYYVKVRAYKTVNGKRIYGYFSKARLTSKVK